MKYKILIRNIEFIIGILLISISFNLFLLPNNLLVGSISSLAIILKHYCNTLPSFFILICTSVFFILNFIFTKKITSKLVIGSILLSSLIQLTSKIEEYLVIDINVLLSTICGAVIIGIGYVLVLKDVLQYIENSKISFKSLLLSTNIFIIVIGTFIFGLTNTLYSLIALYIMYLVIDKGLSKESGYKLVYITVQSPIKIEKSILCNEIYKIKNNNKTLLLYLIPSKECSKLKEQIQTNHPEATFIIMDVDEVYDGK